MAPISAMTIATVHRIGIRFRKPRPRLSSPPVCRGSGLLATRGQAKLTSMAPP